MTKTVAPGSLKFVKVESLADIDSGEGDPLGVMLFAGGSCPDGLNRHSYCHNNPVRYTDPTGEGSYVPGVGWVDNNGDSTPDPGDLTPPPATTPDPVTAGVQTGPGAPPSTTSGSTSPLQPTVGSGNEEKAQQLLKIETSVADPKGDYPQYQEGYPTWEGQNEQHLPCQPGMQTTPFTPTWCQAAADEMLTQAGYDTSKLLNPSGIGGTDANQMAIRAIQQSRDPTSGIVQISPELAYSLAGQGIGVLAIAHNPDGHGHAGVVAPTAGPYDPATGPMTRSDRQPWRYRDPFGGEFVCWERT